MTQCNRCGVVVQDGWTVCPNCGTLIPKGTQGMKNLIIVAIVIAAVIMAALVAVVVLSGSNSNDGDGNDDGGGNLFADDDSIKIQSYNITYEWDILTDYSTVEADYGNYLAIVKLDIINNGTSDVSVSSFDIDKIKTDSGVIYSTSFYGSSYLEDYKTGIELVPGGHTTISLAFEIPEDEKVNQITFSTLWQTTVIDVP